MSYGRRHCVATYSDFVWSDQLRAQINKTFDQMVFEEKVVPGVKSEESKQWLTLHMCDSTSETFFETKILNAET